MNQQDTNSQIITPFSISLPAGYSIISFREGSAGLPGNGRFVRGAERETVTQNGKKPYYYLTLCLPFPVGKTGLTIALFLKPEFEVENYPNLQLNLSNMKANEQALQTDKISFNPGGTGTFAMSRVWLNGVAGIAFDVPQTFFESIVSNMQSQQPTDIDLSENLYLTELILSNPKTDECVSDFDSVIVAHGKNRLPEVNKATDYQTGNNVIAGISASRIMNEKIYDVALSFAGEDRPLAKELAGVLTGNNIKVFYDEYEKADLWGVELYEHLTDVYKNRAQFCVIFVSEHYDRKLWTNHERKAAQARAFEENREYILPIRVDETEVKGILPTVGYLRWQDETAFSITQMIAAKLNKLSSAESTKFEVNSNPKAARQSTNFDVKQLRREHLQNHLAADIALLKEYEDSIRLEEEPKRIAKYKREIERLKISISEYESELRELLK